MWKFMLVCCMLVASTMDTNAARQVSRRRRAGSSAGSYAGSSSGGGGYVGGYAGGYGGGYNSGGGGGGGGGYYDYDDYDGFAPPYGIIDPYLFHQQLTNHVLQQNIATQQAITGLATAGDANAFADATIDNDDTRIQHQIAAQNAYHDNVVRQNRYRPSGGSSYNVHRYAPSYALAAGSIGPSGHRQTAYISPANPATPNIVNRFGASSSSGGGGGTYGSGYAGGSTGGGGGGYKGVSVSSFSSSNGDGTSRRGAQTTINDNGKVTSYSVHS